MKADANSDAITGGSGRLSTEVHVGRYIGHENEEQSPSDAVDGDVIIVRLGF